MNNARILKGVWIRAATASLVLLLVSTMAMAKTQDFEVYSMGSLAPPHSDYAVDTDGDVLYNYLIVNVSIDVTQAGIFLVDSYLTDLSGMNLIAFAMNFSILSTGAQVVPIWFDGVSIRTSGIDGPYQATILLSNDTTIVDNGIHITSSYIHTDFQSPQAMFTPPHADWGLDTDGDTSYDYLVVEASLLVNVSGTYEIMAMLYDSTGINVITSTYNSTFIGTGSQSLELWFSGGEIRASGIDGPYLADMILVKDITLLGMDQHLTSAYLHTDFDEPSAEFDPPHVDYGIDTDVPPDTFYNYLALDTNIKVNESGDYIVQGMLFDSSMTLMLPATNFTYLDVGAQTVQLRFSGKSIYNSGANGPYEIQLFLYKLDNGTMLFLDDDLHMTNFYQYTEFQPAVPAFLTGFVTETGTGAPIDMAIVFVFNFNESYVNVTMTDSLGYYEMNLYEGDFFVAADDTILQAEGQYANVSGSTVLNFTLGPVPPSEMNPTATFSDWDNVNLNITATMQMDNQTLRPILDMLYGNSDGYIDKTEIDRFLGGMIGPMPWPMTDTVDALYVDGIYYDNVPGSEKLIGGGEGPVGAKIPFNFNLEADFVSHTPVPNTVTHLVEVNITYEAPTLDSMLRAEIPYNYALLSYDPVPNVIVTGVGTSSITVDSQTSPGPGQDYVWVNLTVERVVDGTPPEISGVLIDGVTSVTYYLSNLPATATLTAIIDDRATGGSNVGGANYTTPAQASWPGTDMSAVDGTFDESVEEVSVSIPVPTGAGVYRYYLHAWDDVPNANTSSPYATIAVSDDLPPAVTQARVDGQASVMVRPGTDVTLTALVSDLSSGGSNISGANYTLGVGQWPGTTMTVSDGAFDSPEESVQATVDTAGWSGGSHQVCVYGWDAGQGRNTTAQACAEIVIDDQPPVIADVATLPDSPTAGGSVEISANVTDDNGVAGVSVEIWDPQGTRIGNFSMTYNAATGKYERAQAVDKAGDYTYTIWAVDDVGNIASHSSDFAVSAPPQQKSFLEEYWWLLLLIVVIVIVVVLVLLLKRRGSKKAVESPPQPAETRGGTAQPVQPPESGAQPPPPRV